MVDFEVWCRRYGFDGRQRTPPMFNQAGQPLPLETVQAHVEACRKHNIKRQRYLLAYQAQVPPESALAHNIARTAGLPIDWEEL